MKGKAAPQWKPVKLDQEFLAQGVDGLIGIEEMVDYSYQPQQNIRGRILEVNDTSTTKSTSKKKSRKRKKKQSKPIAEELPAKKLKTDEEDKALEETNTEPTQCLQNESINDMESWSGLFVPEPVLKALHEQGFTKPTEIQEKVLPAAIKGRRDILAAAETGSGKTLAFGIPIIHGILQCKKKQSYSSQKNDLEIDIEENEDEVADNYANEEDGGDSTEEKEMNDNDEDDNENKLGCVKVVDKIMIKEEHKSQQNPLYALVLTPTRELAIQVAKHLNIAAKYTGIKVAVVVGGMSAEKQERILKRNPEIVVATPGRLWELIQQGNPHLSQYYNIRFLAIDETDRMVEKGHFQELHNLLEHLNFDTEKRKERQNFILSATLTLVHDIPKYKKKMKKITPGQKIQNIIHMLGVTNPKTVDITQTTGTARTLTEARILCSLEDKDFFLYYFIQKHPGRSLIFCNSISCVRRLAQLLNILECKPLPLHANMIQKQRLKNLDKFRDNPNGLLLATDVAARGLDIPNVQHVIHYQVPRTSESYVHRSGRTARALKEGLTLILVEPGEMKYYTRLLKILGRNDDLPEFPVTDPLFSAVKTRVLLAREVDALELKSRKASSKVNWFKKAAEEMDLVLDDDLVPNNTSKEDSDDEEEKRLDKTVKKLIISKKKKLKSLLSMQLVTGSSISNSGQKLLPLKRQPQSENAVQVVKDVQLKKIEVGKTKNKDKSKLAFKRRRRFKKRKPVSA